jgi:hypothetical protein
MGKLLAKDYWTSEDRFYTQTKEIVNPIKEVLGYVTSDRSEITSADSSIFGETLYEFGQNVQ